MKKRSAKEILKMMIERLTLYLDELAECRDRESEQFEYGEKTAYTECLEWIVFWTHAEKYGLDFDVESRYPLD